jgi:hypothetical protein
MITGLFFAVKRFIYLCVFATIAVFRLDFTLFPRELNATG